MAYILPFQSIHLIVFNYRSSIQLYEYNWRPDSIKNDPILAGMLKTASGILHAKLAGGSIEEIKMEKSTLVIKESEDKDFVYVLISERTSRVLREALNDFAGKFTKAYGHLAEDFANLEKFKDAGKIVSKCFPFIADYHCKKMAEN